MPAGEWLEFIRILHGACRNRAAPAFLHRGRPA